jgi:hypothetical protein
MCLFLSVLEMLIGMLIFVCQWVMKVVLLLSSNVWALFYMWGFFSLCQGIVLRFDSRRTRAPPQIATSKDANKMMLQK